MFALLQIALSAQLALPALTPLAPQAPLAPLTTIAPRFPALPSLSWQDWDAAQAAPLEPASFPQHGDDPADSLLRAASDRMARGDYRAAAELYHSTLRRYPSSARLSEAMYYESFALYRAGDLAKARGALDALRERFPQAAARGDANTLRARVCGELARQGDDACADEVARLSASAGSGRSSGGGTTRAGRRTPAGECPGDDRDGDDENDDDTRVAALNALLQMDAERAMPILTSVLARRDRCSERLRRKAVFLVAQKRTPETANILLAAAKNDPDTEVREQAVFWLSQVRDPRATQMLVDIMHGDGEPALREKALFALSQQRNPEAATALREFAVNTREPLELRKKAIFHLGVTSNAMSGAQLAGLYASLPERELREQVLFAISQRRDAASVDKLMDVARSDPDRELRKKAIFWLGQSRDPRATAFLAELINK